MSMTRPADPLDSEDDIVWDIEDEHLREAEFLFQVREDLLDSPSYSLAELEAGPEQRLIAHVDALVLGGPLVGQRLLLPAIEDEDQLADYELITAASLAALAQPGWDRVLTVLGHGTDAQRAGVARALQLTHNPRLDHRLVEDVATPDDSADPHGLAARLDALAAHGVSPGPYLRRFLLDTDPALARAAASLARAAASLARFSHDRATLDSLGPLALASDPELRRTTIETALFHALPGAWESALYWAFCSGHSPFRRDALVWVACLGNADAHARVVALIDDPKHRADALWAAGFCGRVAAVDRCIPLLSDENVGPLAGEVVSAITGLPSTDDSSFRARVEPDDPEDTLPPLEHDDLDADLVPKREASLPLPNPEAIANWWHARRWAFDPSLRYLHGQPLDRDQLVAGLWDAPLRRRHVLGFELGVRSGAHVDTRAMCATQKRQLDALATVDPFDCQRGLPLR